MAIGRAGCNSVPTGLRLQTRSVFAGEVSSHGNRAVDFHPSTPRHGIRPESAGFPGTAGPAGAPGTKAIASCRSAVSTDIARWRRSAGCRKSRDPNGAFCLPMLVPVTKPAGFLKAGRRSGKRSSKGTWPRSKSAGNRCGKTANPPAGIWH